MILALAEVKRNTRNVAEFRSKEAYKIGYLQLSAKLECLSACVLKGVVKLPLQKKLYYNFLT
jgi:hypothetical protein